MPFRRGGKPWRGESPGEPRAHVGLNRRPEVVDSRVEESPEDEGRSRGLSNMGNGGGAALRRSRLLRVSERFGGVFKRQEGTSTGDGDQAAREEQSSEGRTPGADPARNKAGRRGADESVKRLRKPGDEGGRARQTRSRSRCFTRGHAVGDKTPREEPPLVRTSNRKPRDGR
jgi:hypothetical protein